MSDRHGIEALSENWRPAVSMEAKDRESVAIEVRNMERVILGPTPSDRTFNRMFIFDMPFLEYTPRILWSVCSEVCCEKDPNVPQRPTGTGVAKANPA